MRAFVVLVAALVAFVLAETVTGQGLSFSGTPALGQSVSFITTGPPNAIYALAISSVAGPSNFPPIGTIAIGQPFGFLVAPIAAPGFIPTLDPTGQAVFSILIPNSIPLFGQTFYLQSVYGDPASPFGLSLTNGVSITIANPAVAPTIATVSPTSGGASGGTPLTITGTNFQAGGTSVTLGGQSLLNLQFINSTELTGTTPAGTAGTTVDLVVSTVAGGSATLVSAYSYLAEPPTITSITPDHSQVGGGVLITITGTGLAAGTTVYIAGVPLTPITQSAAQILAFAPTYNQLGFVDVVAISPLGISFYPASFRYTIPLDTGTGADGPFLPTTNTTLDTTNNQGVFNFTEVNIPTGVTVTGTGPFPLRIKCRGAVTISGVLDVSAPVPVGGAGGLGGPGGYRGGDGALQPMSSPQFGFGPGAGNGSASYGTTACSSNPPMTYGNAEIVPLLGGSGGQGIGSVSTPTQPPAGGGGGGGAIEIASSNTILLAGTIRAEGAIGSNLFTMPWVNSGSGGAIRLLSQGSINITGIASVRGGTFQSPQQTTQCGGNGRWFIQNWLGQSSNGVTAEIPNALY